MPAIEIGRVSPDTIQEHKDVLTAFLSIGESVGLFGTDQLADQKLIYQNPGAIDVLITVLSYLKDRHASGWESTIPSFLSVKELEDWAYANYVDELKRRKVENKFTDHQLQSYDKELQAMEKDIAKRRNGETNRIAGVDVDYMPMWWTTIIQDNQDKLVHKTIEHALTFIPTQTTMLADTLNDKKIKQFIETHHQQIDLMKPIISLFPKADTDLQSAVFANLILCKLDTATVSDLTSKLSAGIQSGDYYDFVKYLGELVLGYAKSKGESHMGAKNTREGISFVDLKIGELHGNKDPIGLKWIHKPNQTLLPEDCTDLWAFLAKNPHANLFEILLANK